MNETLSTDIWQNQSLDRDVSEKLLTIALDLITSLAEDIDQSIEIEDVLLLGSMASYHYKKTSDIDLHIVLDFEQFKSNEKVSEQLLRARAAIWNLQHEIAIEGHEVEVYFQDVDEENKSAGVYSLLDDIWVEQPTRVEIPQTLEDEAAAIARKIADKANYLELLARGGPSESIYQAILKLRKWVRNYRRRGLDSEDGIASLENVVFKTLRDLGVLDSLKALELKIYDSLHSL